MYYEKEIQEVQNLCIQTNESSFINACFKTNALYIMKK